MLIIVKMGSIKQIPYFYKERYIVKMVIEDGKFYFIKEAFFDKFKDYSLMENKDRGTRRPCYFCFRDRKDKEIIWFVPISTKYDKYKKIYDNKKIKSENRAVYNFVFGNVLGKKAVFLIQKNI